MKKYVLSIAADRDLSDIFDYTERAFGLDKAIDYVSGFNESFHMICMNPLIGRDRSEIRDELRSFSRDSHVIFYRVLDNHIRIVRILSSYRDLQKFDESG